MKKTNLGKFLVFGIGILIFALGLYSLTIPVQVVATIAIVAGVAILCQGVIEIYTFIRVKDGVSRSGLVLFGAMIDLIFAYFILSNILATAIAMTLLVGFWYLFTSLLRIVRAFELKRFGASKWWVVLLTGILSTALSLLILMNPIAGGLLITYSVAFSIMGSGIMIIAESFSN